MTIQTISLLPAVFETVLGQSMMFKAQQKRLVKFIHHDLRQYGIGPRRQVDDKPYGGGDGMLLMIEPLWRAISEAKRLDPRARVIITSPRGERWRQSLAAAYAAEPTGLIFVCGRYEGFDERVMSLVDHAYSAGDFVLTGGELPALVMIDSIVRLIPGVLGGATSAQIESFADGRTLEYPQYTRPEEFNGARVPEVLLSGDHAAIARWRQRQSKKLS
ncbi:MAG: tRNA (guanosine(37)-N1)-methyltransferase TrmD [Candidatus Chaera renei]|uniref:tRNA (guanine-N(1)-)-methyltransferase n=1 Tax=Candidatus Chaera renei TaxID=2506947 RepID=A0A4Q0AK30_9BACT|nr:MAG: tRNA (guanosine(37)-N1)-methyltransferase TrmD [Candidatus Chaera renei]